MSARATAVIVAAREPARIREALRAAVGLGLRGSQVTAYLGEAAALLRGDPAVARCLGTLAQLGQHVVDGEPEPDALAERTARIERWTDAGDPRVVRLRAGERSDWLALAEADPAALIERLLASSTAALW